MSCSEASVDCLFCHFAEIKIAFLSPFFPIPKIQHKSEEPTDADHRSRKGGEGGRLVETAVLGQVAVAVEVVEIGPRPRFVGP